MLVSTCRISRTVVATWLKSATCNSETSTCSKLNMIALDYKSSVKIILNSSEIQNEKKKIFALVYLRLFTSEILFFYQM